jgi:hypothetical protein
MQRCIRLSPAATPNPIEACLCRTASLQARITSDARRGLQRLSVALCQRLILALRRRNARLKTKQTIFLSPRALASSLHHTIHERKTRRRSAAAEIAVLKDITIGLLHVEVEEAACASFSPPRSWQVRMCSRWARASCSLSERTRVFSRPHAARVAAASAIARRVLSRATSAVWASFLLLASASAATDLASARSARNESWAARRFFSW